VLTARSGRAALKHRVEKLGYRLSKAKLDNLYQEFLVVADKKKEINDEDLKVLVGKEKRGPRSIELISLQVTCGSSSIPTATVSLDIQGEVLSESAIGNGPIDAAFTAVKKMFNKKVRLEEFLIQAITRGSDDLGKVHVQVAHKNSIYYGFSANTDIVTASVEAFIDALAQIV
jgi:2-isopropylmalate synthase